MGRQRTTFGKVQRERDKQAKAAAKRDRRQGGRPSTQADADKVVDLVLDDGKQLSAPELLALIESVHRRFDAHEISFEEFEDIKADLLRRLPVD